MTKNKRKDLPPLNTNAHRSETEGADPAVIGLGDVTDHLEKLGRVSSTTQKLMNLLGEQLQGLAWAIPVLRGTEAVKELRRRSEASRDGIQSAFELLRDQIEREKAIFYDKNAKAIEEMIRKRVEAGVKQRLPAALEERLQPYRKYIETNGTLTGEVKQLMAATSARDLNSTLCPNHPAEGVVFIPPHPDWAGLTLANLKTITGPGAAKLARDQGLTPSEGPPNSKQARIRNLNMIFRHLGVQYQVVPSWNGILLTSLATKTNR